MHHLVTYIFTTVFVVHVYRVAPSQMVCVSAYDISPCTIKSRRFLLALAHPGGPGITTTTTTVLQPFFREHQGEPVPEENFWALWCKGRLTEADTATIWRSAIPSALTSAHLHHPTIFTGQMPFLPPNQQCQSTEAR